MTPRVRKAAIFYAVGGIIAAIHVVLMVGYPFRPWVFFNAAIGAFLVYAGVLIHREKDES